MKCHNIIFSFINSHVHVWIKCTCIVTLSWASGSKRFIRAFKDHARFLFRFASSRLDSFTFVHISDRPKKYLCDKCKKEYKNKGSLIRHTKLECGKPPQFNCPFCSHACKQKTNLLRHINNVHGIFIQTSRENRDTLSSINDTLKYISCKKLWPSFLKVKMSEQPWRFAIWW